MSSWGMELKRVPLQALSVGSQQQRQEINPQLPRPRLAAEPQDHSSPAPAITATAPPKGLQAPQHSRTLQAEQASKTSLPERLKGCWGLSPWCRKGSCCYPRPNHSAPRLLAGPKEAWKAAPCFHLPGSQLPFSDKKPRESRFLLPVQRFFPQY